MRNISVDFVDEKPLTKQHVELVERKGIGHPDSICDGIAEAVSRALSKEYLSRFDCIMHHNTDQVELVGGLARPSFGGGEIEDPIYILLSGRATNNVDGKEIPIGEIAIKAAREYLGETMPHINLDSGVEFEQKIGMGSSDLRNVFCRDGIPKSNDTSFGVGYAPFSLVEQLTYETEKYLNGDLEKKIPASGQDIKVMGVRVDDKITLTIANAMVDKHLDSIEAYQDVVAAITDEVTKFVGKITDKEVKAHVNTGDNIEAGSVFLTCTGTSAEQGDDGSVGRGNRANGLITPYRPMSMEATSGKNPVNHVGKIYNLLSKEIARDIAGAGAEQVYVRLMSQIGKPIDNPLIASVQVVGDKSLEKQANDITDDWLSRVTEMTQKCVEGKAETF